MNNSLPLWVYVIMLALCNSTSAFANVLLKKAALHNYNSFVKRYINIYCIFGYGILLLMLFCGVFLLRFIPFYVGAIVGEPLGLILSFVNGRIFFGEKITRNKLIGGILIFCGIILVVLF